MYMSLMVYSKNVLSNHEREMNGRTGGARDGKHINSPVCVPLYCVWLVFALFFFVFTFVDECLLCIQIDKPDYGNIIYFYDILFS